MKHGTVSFLVVTLMLASGLAFAPCNTAQCSSNLSWWAQSGATPDPVKDARYGGYWWWPIEPASNAGDAELWGNRGVVYGSYTAAAAPAPPPPPPPPEPVAPMEPPKVVRQIPVFNHVLFDFDKAILKPAGKVETNKVVEWLKTYPNDTLVIEGHTCDIGTDEYNMGLGQRRSDAVARHLIANGIDSSRITTVSYGESQPAVPNDSKSNRELNRRGMFKITVVD